MGDREDRFERQPLGTQAQHVIGLQLADQGLAAIARHLERPVVLREAFVEPHGRRAHDGVHDGVDVLVIDDPERFVSAVLSQARCSGRLRLG